MTGGPTPGATATGGPAPTASAPAPRPTSEVSTRPAGTQPPSRPASTVPNVVGQTAAAATATLQAAGFTVSQTKDCASPNVPAGVVLAQSPAAGTQAGRQPTVTLQVASECVTVPTVVGSPADEANSALQSAGFNVTYGGEWNCPWGYGPVTAQSPAGGTRVARGGYVSITYVCASGAAQPTSGGS